MATISDLPAEILEYILSLVSPYEDLHSCMSVSQQWRKYVQNVVKRRKRNLNRSIANFDVKWHCFEAPEGYRCICKRYSHSAAIFDNAMYVFGGCTSSMTTFNDLWKFDLSTRKWFRPLAVGNYPAPKACSSFVKYKNTLVLLGGWAYPPSYPLYQTCHLYNELHVLDVQDHNWIAIETSFKPPPLAGHSISVIDNDMIVFGGLVKYEDSEDCVKSNEVWKLNLLDWTWVKQDVGGTRKPECRFGQTQVIINKENIFIIGGSGGAQIDYSDAWVLNMSKENEWKWIPVEIKGKANKPKNIWSHPGCKVDNKVIFLNRIQTDTIFPLNSCRKPLQFDGEGPSSVATSASKQPDLDGNVNGKWGTLRFPVSNESIPIEPPVSPTDGHGFQNKRRKPRQPKNFLGLYVLDLEHVTDVKPYVTWLTPKNFTKGPQETLLYTFLEGKSELIMFGGIESDGPNIGGVKNPITNSIHIMSSNVDVI